MLHFQALHDAHLVRRGRKGDQQALAELIELHLPAVKAVSYAILGSHGGVDDAVQETFLRALQNLAQLREPRKLRAWLTGIARNTSRDIARKQQRYVPLEASEIPDAGIEPDLERRETHQLLFEQIQQLDATSREALLLHYYAGKSTREIAATLDVSIEVVKKRLQRARTALGSRLIHCMGDTLESKDDRKRLRDAIVATLLGASVAGIVQTSRGAVASAGIGMGAKFAAAAAAIAVLAAFGVFSTRGLLPQRRDNQPAPHPTASAPTAVVPVEQAPPAALESPGPPEEQQSASKLYLTGWERTPLVDLFVPAWGQVGRRWEIERDYVATLPREGGPGVIAGQVLHPEGLPNKGVEVRLERRDWADKWAPAAPFVIFSQTDGEGRYTFRNLPLDRYTVSAMAPGYLGVATADLSPTVKVAQAPVALQRAEPIAGRVVDAQGRAVPGAEVYPYARPNEAREPRISVVTVMRTVTDTEGRFEMDGMWLGNWQLYVRHPEYRPAISENVRAGQWDATIVMERGATVNGKVEDTRTGEAAAGVRLLIPSSYIRSQRQFLSDANGRFSITGLIPGRHELLVWDSDKAATNGPVVLEIDGNESLEISVPVAEGAVATGRVIDAATGEPVAGVVVEASAPYQYLSAPSGADGRFYITGLPPGNHTVQTLPSPSRPYRSTRQPFQVAEAALVELPDLTLRGGATVSGTVQDADGVPIAGAYVEMDTKGATQSTCTGQNGRFSFMGFSPGETASLSVAQSGYARHEKRDITLPDGDLDDLNITLDREAIVEGKLFRVPMLTAVYCDPNLPEEAAVSTGQPLSSGILYAANSETGFGVFSPISRDGRFKFDCLPKGRYSTYYDTSSTSYERMSAGTFEVEEGMHKRDVRLEIRMASTRPSGDLTIAGTLRDDRGLAIPWATIRLHLTTRYEDRTSVRADALGRFRFEDLAPGDYTLTANVDGYAPDTKNGIQAGDEAVPVVLTRLGSVRGRVSDALTGVPLPKFYTAIIRPCGCCGDDADNASTNRLAYQDMTYVESSDGSFVIEDLHGGASFVVVRAPGHAVAKVPVDIPYGGDLDGVEVRLGAEAVLEGYLVAMDGRPIANANVHPLVHARECYSRSSEIHTGADGSFSVPMLPVDVPIAISFSAEGFLPTEHSLSLRAGLNQSGALVIRQPGIVRGRVTLDGKPSAQASVYISADPDAAAADNGSEQTSFYWQGLSRSSAATDDSGYYSIDEVPPGTVTVHVSGGFNPQCNTNAIEAIVGDGMETVVDFTLNSCQYDQSLPSPDFPQGYITLSHD